MKTKNKLKWIPSILLGMFLLMSSVLKFRAFGPIAQLFSEVGLGRYLPVFAIMELLFAAAFLYNRSMQIGLLLLTAYYGGAAAIELSRGMAMIAPLSILTFAWIAAYLRRPSIFRFSPVTQRTQIL